MKVYGGSPNGANLEERVSWVDAVIQARDCGFRLKPENLGVKKFLNQFGILSIQIFTSSKQVVCSVWLRVWLVLT